MIKGFKLTYNKQFDGEWYQKTIDCKDFDSLQEWIEKLDHQYTFKIVVLRDSSGKV